jgi:hypothetical protein
MFEARTLFKDYRAFSNKSYTSAGRLNGCRIYQSANCEDNNGAGHQIGDEAGCFLHVRPVLLDECFALELVDLSEGCGAKRRGQEPVSGG